MKFTEIQSLNTCVTAIPQGCTGVHESTLRAYQILQRTKDFLRRGVPADVLLELIAEMEAA
jgi:hypothetical protein